VRAKGRVAAPEVWRRKAYALCAEIIDAADDDVAPTRAIAARPKLSEVNRLVAAAHAIKFTALEADAFAALQRVDGARARAHAWLSHARGLLGDRLGNERSMRIGLRGATNALAASSAQVAQSSAAVLTTASVGLSELRASEASAARLHAVPHAAYVCSLRARAASAPRLRLRAPLS
jgi:hypothetical protein